MFDERKPAPNLDTHEKKHMNLLITLVSYLWRLLNGLSWVMARSPEILLAIGCAIFAWYAVALMAEGAAVQGLWAVLGVFVMAGGVALHRRVRMSTDDQRAGSAQRAVDARQRNIEREMDAAIEAAKRTTS